ncbi:MAG: adenylyltransferase/cytidyltransferase family protein [Clostridia bacterium]
MKTGYIIGRFNHLTSGHVRIIEIGLETTDKLLIFIGSADKSGTDRNPFKIETRLMLLQEVFADEIKSGKIILAPLKDLSNELDVPKDGAWGRYILDNAAKVLGAKPNISIYGLEEARTFWYSKEDLKDVEEIVYIRKEDSISATDIRRYLREDNKEAWLLNTPEKIHKYYFSLREEILKINGGKK